MVGGIRQFLVILAGVLILPCQATASYTVVYEDGTSLEENILNSTKDQSQVTYGITTIQYGTQPIEKVKLNHKEFKDDPDALFFVGTAEAASGPIEAVIRSYQAAHSKVKQAWHLNDVKPYIAKPYYQQLNERVQAGSNELIVLELMKNLMPADPEVYDIRVSKDTAKIAARGTGVMGHLNGIIQMVHEDGSWKLANERWFGGDQNRLQNSSRVRPIKLTRHTYSPDSADPLEDLSQEYNFNRLNPLGLSQTDINLPKDSISFVFLMEHGEKETPGIPLEDEKQKKQLHVVWTGPKKIFSGQKQYNQKISMGHEKEGYKEDNVNLRLPKKKPKQITAALFYKF